MLILMAQGVGYMPGMSEFFYMGGAAKFSFSGLAARLYSRMKIHQNIYHEELAMTLTMTLT